MKFPLDDPDFYLADPHAAFRWMREHEPVYWCERGRLWAICCALCVEATKVT